MNTIKVYKTDGTLKYTFLPSSASTQEADGHISSQRCYMASDDTGAELEGGSRDFEALSKKVLDFSKGIFHGVNCVVIGEVQLSRLI